MQYHGEQDSISKEELRMNKKLVVIGGLAVALLLACVALVVAAGLWLGATRVWGQADANMMSRLWNRDGRPDAQGYGGSGMMGSREDWYGGELPCAEGYAGPGMMGEGWEGMPCTEGYAGPGMMGEGWEAMPCTEGDAGPGMMGEGWEGMPCSSGTLVPEGESLLSLGQAEAAVERYVDHLGYANLHVTEVMEFERNFYAIVAEEESGIGAMELLVEKTSGTVGPEPGPNMMWNAKYGMHGGGRMGMMGGNANGDMTLSPVEAEAIAQRWLDANLPGRTAGEADPFYGYYTLHFLKDGEIEGMLSVHGSSGDVWFHSWHGDFIAMAGDHD
jgi:hypothetical protein